MSLVAQRLVSSFAMREKRFSMAEMSSQPLFRLVRGLEGGMTPVLNLFSLMLPNRGVIDRHDEIMTIQHTVSPTLTWRTIWTELRGHRRALLRGNLIALLAVACAVPVPLFLPILVDEVLLKQPGGFIAFFSPWFPSAWHGPVLFISIALVVTLGLRLASILLNVWQSRTFSLISKEVVFRIRARMLDRLSRIALSEYETLGSGRVTSHFITDLNAVDGFLGASISGFLVALLSLAGVAVVLLWMNWQLALFILL